VSTPADPPSGIRIGNDERTAAQRALDEHLAAGRLEMDEFADRYAMAGVARTRADLDALFTDLPAPHPFTPPPPPTSHVDQWRRFIPPPGVVRVMLMVLAGAALISVLPFFATGALVWFVIIPMLSGRRGGWYRGGRGWRY
jgi:Domain of unknown function (DUF1707)